MSEAALQRNIRLYPIYVFATNLFFWVPIFFLYFSSKLTLSEVLQLEAFYYFVVVLAEVPSGYFSDRFGRRLTLLLSSSSLVIGYIFFAFGSSFIAFAAGQLFFASWRAFSSGADTSLHFESLKALGREDEYSAREAIASKNMFLAPAIASIVGGIAGSYFLSLAYILSLFAGSIALFIAVLFVEPTSESFEQKADSQLFTQIRACLRFLKDPALAWILGFFTVMMVLNHFPYEFYQGYIDLVDASWMGVGQSTPLISGIHNAIAMCIAAFVASRSITIRNFIGLRYTLLSALFLQLMLIGLMSQFLSPVVVVLLVLRAVPTALMNAPINAAVAPKVDEGHRATYLSLHSLSGRLAFSVVIFGLAHSVSDGVYVNWIDLSRMLSIGLLFAACSGLVLGLSSRRIQKLLDI